MTTSEALLICRFCGGRLSSEHTACPHCGCVRVAASHAVIPFTGRGHELALLYEQIDRVCAGRGGMVGIAGPAGIGKTRLAEAALDYAKEQRCYDFLIRGFEPSAEMPFWAMTEAIHSTLARSDGAAVNDPAVAGLRQLNEALRGAREAGSPASTTVFEARDAGVHARIYDASTAVLRGVTADRPLVLVADDLQWIDPATLNLMRYAVRMAKTLPILLIFAYRDDGEGASSWRPVLEDGAREGLFTELSLGGLDPAAARHLALAAAPAPLSDRAVEQALRLSEGNPFYLSQLARALAAAPTDSARSTLPAALRGITDQRLAGLSRNCRTLVQAIAVVGRGCPLDLLATITPLALAEMAVALDEALTAHVLAERESGGAVHYDFTHALLREAATRDLKAVSRAGLHLRVADALHRRREAGNRDPAGEVAGHYLEALPLSSVEQTLAYAREAADEASSLGAHERAARFLFAEIGLLQGQGAPPAEIAALRLRLLEAYALAGDGDAAEREGAAALAFYEQAGDQRAVAAVHALLSEHLNPRLRARDVLVHAGAGLAILGDERTPLAARLRFLRAHARLGLDDTGELLEAADWLAAGGFEPPEPAAEIWSRLLRVLWHIWSRSSAATVLTLIAEATEHTRRAGDRRAEALTRVWQGEVLNRDARPLAALAALDEAVRLARAAGSAPLLVDAGALRCESLLQLGRWQELEQAVDETLPALVRLRSTYFGYTLVSAHSWSRRLRGQSWAPPTGLELRFRDSNFAVMAYRTESARVAMEFGGRGERTDRLLDWLVANVPVANEGIAWATAGVPLLAALTLAGRRDDVAARIGGAAENSRFLQSISYGPLELARAAVLLKRWDDAEAYFDQAISIAVDEGLRVALARTLIERGAAYRRRGRRGDRSRAAEVLGRALELCEELGLAPDAARTRALLDELGAAPAPRRPAGLTAREAEVLRLLAGGASNRGIATELVISEKTVEQHLLNLYQKLQVDSRAKAVAFAYANDLV